MKFKYEIIEEIEDNLPVYWVIKKGYFLKVHIYSQLIGQDNHGEIPFYNLIAAEEILKCFTDGKH